MTKETMTVHEALCEMKVLPKRIEKAIDNIEAVSTKEQQSEKVDGIEMSKFAEEAKANSQKASDLIKRFVAIKSGVNQYNAGTSIEISGHTYTIAQAIWLKDHGMEHKRRLMNWYAQQLTSAQETIQENNGFRLTQRAEAAANANFGSKDKADGEEYLKFVNNYKNRYQTILVDPLDIKKTIQELDDEITGFETAIDSALQIANATHTIEIEY